VNIYDYACWLVYRWRQWSLSAFCSTYHAIWTTKWSDNQTVHWRLIMLTLALMKRIASSTLVSSTTSLSTFYLLSSLPSWPTSFLSSNLWFYDRTWFCLALTLENFRICGEILVMHCKSRFLVFVLHTSFTSSRPSNLWCLQVLIWSCQFLTSFVQPSWPTVWSLPFVSSTSAVSTWPR